jgi:hypothetical protein
MSDNSTRIILSAVDNATPALQKAASSMLSLGQAATMVQGQLAAIGASISVGGFAALISSTIKAQEKLHDLSQQTGATVEALSGIAAVAKLSNTDIDQVAGGLQKLAKNMNAAATGGRDQQAVFQALGVSIKDTSGNLRDSGSVMQDVAKAMASIVSPTERVAAAQLLFGKSGAQLVPVLNDMATAGDLVVKTTTAQAALADNISDNITRLGLVYSGTGKIIVNEMLPALDSFVQTMFDAARESGNLKDTVRGIAADGTLKEWGESAAMGVARLVDVLRTVKSMLEDIELPLERYFRAAQSGWAGLYIQAFGGSVRGEALSELFAQADQWMRDKYNKPVQQGFDTSFSDSLARNLQDPWRGWTDKQKEYAERAAEVAKAYTNYPIEVQRAAMEELTKAYFGKRKKRFGGEGDGDTVRAQFKNRLEAIRAGTAAELQALDYAHEAGLTSEQAYQDEKLQAAISGIDRQILAVQEKLATTKDDKWRVSLEGDLLKLVEEAGKADAVYMTFIAKANKARANFWEQGQQQITAAAAAQAEELEKRAQAAEDENARIGVTSEQIAELTRRRYDEQIAIRRARADTLRGIKDREGEVAALDQQIAALERLRDAEVARPKLQAQAQAWENFTRDIEQSLTDALMRSFEAGDSFGEAFAKNLQNIFKTMVLKVVVQAVVGGTGSLFGLNMAGSGVSGLGNITNLASSWNGGGLFGNAADYAYTASGLRYGTGFMSDQSTQLAAQEWGLGSSGIPFGGMLSAYSIGGTRGFATGVGSTALAGGIGGMASGAGFASGAYGALASLGPYGWAALAAAAILGMDQGGGTPHAGGIAFSSGDGYTTPSTEAGIRAYYVDQSAADQMVMKDWTKRFSQTTANALGSATEGFAKTFNSIVTSNGRAGGYQFGLAFSADGEDPIRARTSILDAAGNQVAWTRDYNALGSDPQHGLQLMMTEQVPRLMLTALEGMDLNALANSFLDSLDIEHLSAEAAQQALNFVAATDEIITALGHLGIGADEVTTQLIKSLGGIDVAAAALDAYYQGFYSEARRGADATADVKAKFTALGLVMPLTTEGFVDLMDSLDLTTESGRATYAQLLQLSPQFLVVADAAQKAAQAWAGFDAAGLGQMMLDAAFNPAAGKSAADSFAETLDSSVRNALISSTVGNVATMIYNSIVVPMVAGAAVSQAAIDSVVQQAQAALTSLGTVLKNLDLSAITSATAALLPSIASYAPQRSVAQVAASEARQIADSQAQAAAQIKQEWQSVADAILGTMRELRGEILDDSRNFAAEQARFAIATAAARAGDQSAAQQLPDLARSVVDLGKAVTATAAEQALLTARTLASLGQTVNLLDQQYGLDIPAFASGGYHAGGLRVVGEDGPELEATGPARIFSNGQLRDALQGGNLGDELRALRNEVSALRTENATLQRAIATHTFNTAKTLQRITPDGDAMATRTAA